jgi:uncharacterized beta-barrel protein YwiB (DUF1934 family)
MLACHNSIHKNTHRTTTFYQDMQITIPHESVINDVYQAEVMKDPDISFIYNTLHNANKSDNINVSIQIKDNKNYA